MTKEIAVSSTRRDRLRRWFIIVLAIVTALVGLEMVMSYLQDQARVDPATCLALARMGHELPGECR